ncbi:MAG: aminotransferase class V-fold PLP-dependent enzyme [Kordiimonadaceae bacterium]|jgi:cysteine desulfurase|nr:aminotransferase class V-fold PLP-dependent enzyme [Kordiimonadaceae bacterium]MBT6032807.1 aminotransferase class V-fold PLP-dependent enzyme [Kordiimonadaceae bacterium]
MAVKLPIYLDYQATTPIDQRVLEAMMPYLTTHFGNPHSSEHSFGWQTEAVVEIARKQVAELIGAHESEIIFTSGATESNNIAIKGTAYGAYPKRNHIITVKTEHECLLASANSLESSGFDVTYLSISDEGLIDLKELEFVISDKTSLVSVMAVNNEIGTIQNLQRIGEICLSKNVLFHSDAAQAVGKIPLDVDKMNIDIMSISGHKIYGPKGIGALYVRKGTRVIPLFDGGGQEKGLRSGTLSPALCAGIGKACELAGQDMQKDQAHVDELSSLLIDKLSSGLDNASINGGIGKRYFGNLNLKFSGVKSDLLVADLKDIAISTGSACSSAKARSSYVLSALGLSENEIASSVRIGIGRMTTVEEIEYAADHIIKCVKNLL